jgi:hypothetical protein
MFNRKITGYLPGNLLGGSRQKGNLARYSLKHGGLKGLSREIETSHSWYELHSSLLLLPSTTADFVMSVQ